MRPGAPAPRQIRVGRPVVAGQLCQRRRNRAKGAAADRHIQMLALSPEQCLLAAAMPSRSDAYAVVEVNDAVSEPVLVEEFELRADVVRQCALAATHHDGPEEQMALVD